MSISFHQHEAWKIVRVGYSVHNEEPDKEGPTREQERPKTSDKAGKKMGCGRVAKGGGCAKRGHMLVDDLRRVAPIGPSMVRSPCGLSVA